MKFLADPVSFVHVTCLASVGTGVEVPPWVLPSPTVCSLSSNDKNRTGASKNSRRKATLYPPTPARPQVVEDNLLSPNNSADSFI